MNVSARVATLGDLEEILRLYGLLTAEMIPLEPIWPDADGLPEPESAALEALIADPATVVLVGEIDGVAAGMLIGSRESLPGRDGRREVGSVRYIFTEADAREVGVGEAMIEAFLASERAAGVVLFDAHVTPGHRLTKNFFESKGFSARSIVMHHDDRDDA
jgi:GNAT superfamily N-acetyltransferase